METASLKNQHPALMELLQAALSPFQLPFTILLGLVVFYWLLVILGTLDFDTDLVPDLDHDDAGGLHLGHGTDGAAAGLWLTAGRFLGFTQVPVVVWGSFLVLFLWLTSLIFNDLFNTGASAATALLLLPPNFFVSALATKLVTMPVAKLFAAMANADTEAEEVTGRIGTVITNEVDEHYGQLEIPGKGAPLLINVRLAPGSTPLPRGGQARVTGPGPDHAYYFIEPA